MTALPAFHAIASNAINSSNASIAAIGHRSGRSNTSGLKTSNGSNAGITHSSPWQHRDLHVSNSSITVITAGGVRGESKQAETATPTLTALLVLLVLLGLQVPGSRPQLSTAIDSNAGISSVRRNGAKCLDVRRRTPRLDDYVTRSTAPGGPHVGRT